MQKELGENSDGFLQRISQSDYFINKTYLLAGSQANIRKNKERDSEEPLTKQFFN